ncbi:cupin domain-containing protein [Kribbella qitaiheensis]|uniref:Cupin domain-containing protein n=1 Tax=Kribbella qitaiheensis TaxID=1544730 RepID=A0A7G6WXN7_9ACTN|nr:cupin domain-containing protein [Kribbella qitaiheensis]QNE18752.1 cupin domain-containing protein [Kribbella qitaiheensis]
MSELTMLLDVTPPFLPPGAEVMTATIDLAPGDPGTPPHRHSGPVFGYVLEGELLFELEGEDPRVIHAGEAFWEPGGDLIHYQAANNLPDRPTRFVIVMLGVPGEPMLTLVAAAELETRRHRRGASPSDHATQPAGGTPEPEAPRGGAPAELPAHRGGATAVLGAQRGGATAVLGALRDGATTVLGAQRDGATTELGAQRGGGN